MSRSGQQSAKARGSKASPALAKLRRGEITLEEYIEEKTQQATQHLINLLSDEELEVVRDTVRTQLRSDPRTLELLQRATAPELPPTG